MNLTRIYHPVDLWEEVKFNMWGDVSNTRLYLEKAIEFTGNHKLYGFYMQRVINEWKYSCENALTDKNLNRKAWIGHAACALAINCPEDITRKAWSYLTYEQQRLANNEARHAIALWENNHAKSRGIHQPVEIQML